MWHVFKHATTSSTYYTLMSNYKPESKEQTPLYNSCMADPRMSLFLNTEITRVNFLPVGKAKLNFSKPGDWCDYPDLPKSTVDNLSGILTPAAYLMMHYDTKNAFSDVVKKWLHAPYTKFKYLHMKNGSLEELDQVKNKEECRVLHNGLQTKINAYVTTMNLNVLKTRMTMKITIILKHINDLFDHLKTTLSHLFQQYRKM